MPRRFALLAAVLLIGAGATEAGAQTPDPPRPSCPDEPAAYSGTDDVVAEIRALRADERTSCLAAVDRVEAVAAAVADLPGPGAVVDALADLDASVKSIGADADAPLNVTADWPAAIEPADPSVAINNSSDAAHADAAALGWGLFFVGGLLTVGFCAPIVRRWWLP